VTRIIRHRNKLFLLCSLCCLGLLLAAFYDATSRESSFISPAWAGDRMAPLARAKDRQPLIELHSAQAPACATETAPQHASTQLRRDGRWLIDPHGRVVLLHGMNAIWKTAPYVPPDSPEGFVAEDASWLQQQGFNAARIGVLFPGVMPRRGQIDETYLDAWDRIVQLLADQQIWMLFDFHQDMFSEKFQGNGFPEWSVYKNVPAAHKARHGFPRNYLVDAVQHQYDLLYKNSGDIWNEYGQAWQAVAEKWRAQPYHLGYDLMNEPWPGSDWMTCANPLSGCEEQDGKLQAFFDAVRQDIRNSDLHNLVWYEPFLTFDFGTPNHFGKDAGHDDAQLGFSYHSYCLTGAALNMAGITGLPGCKAQHARVARNAEKVIENMGAASLMTEFGANQDLRDMRQATEVADENLVGWMYWHYKNWQDPTTQSQGRGEQSMFEDDADLDTARLAKLRILSRAYPQYTAGIPQKLSFDPDTGRMAYRYTPRRSSAKTELFVPLEVHYPWGYRLQAEGVESVEIAEDGRRLIVTEQEGACEVKLHIHALQAG